MKHPVLLNFSPPITGDVGLLTAHWLDTDLDALVTEQVIIFNNEVDPKLVLNWPIEILQAIPILLEQWKEQ